MSHRERDSSNLSYPSSQREAVFYNEEIEVKPKLVTRDLRSNPKGIMPTLLVLDRLNGTFSSQHQRAMVDELVDLVAAAEYGGVDLRPLGLSAGRLEDLLRGQA